MSLLSARYVDAYREYIMVDGHAFLLVVSIGSYCPLSISAKTVKNPPLSLT
jgi:hypothetical protein